jgi:hypothetical protein
MLDVLGYIKSWPALYSELKRLHESDVVTDLEECSDVSVYVKNHSPSWRDIARAAYYCGEEAVMERIFKYVALDLNRDKVHAHIQNHVKGREAFERLYEYMRLPPLVMNMPHLAGIDLWLLTCPCSWRELAWTFYRCQLLAAVIEVKTFIIEDESFTPENIHMALSKMTDVVTDSEECGDVSVYVKNHSPSWKVIARAAYCCGEEAVMDMLHLI